MNNIKSIIIILSVSFLINGTSLAQKETVILYNSQPVKVELSEKGTIKSFIGLVPGYMLGYDLITNGNAKVEIVDNDKVEIKSDEGQNAGYSIISSERIDLEYKPYFATLDNSTINKLNDIAAKLRVNPNMSILITAHTLDNNQSILASNRLESAIAYLGIKGISADRIQFETQQSKDLKDIVSIHYLN